MSFAVAALRRDTPGVERVAHLNNAGSALPPQVVVDTVVDHLRREAEIGGYEAAAEAAPRLDGVYRSLARLINARPEEIGVVENATRAWDMAVYGYPFAPGDRVLTGRAEYASNVIALLQLQRRTGIELVLVEDDEDGQLSLDALATELDRGAVMVALTHVPTNGGLVNPAEAVGALCREAGVCFVLDACQSAGQLPLDVERLGCSVLSATGRKFLRGPRGTGFLYCHPDWLERIEPPLLDLHAATWTAPEEYIVRPDARRFENWETSIAGKLGLGAAVDYALACGVEDIWSRVRVLAERLREELAAIDGVRVHDKGAVRGAITTFTIDGVAAGDAVERLRAAGVNTSVSLAAYSRFDLPHRGVPDVVRASVHAYNTDEELARLLGEVRALAAHR